MSRYEKKGNAVYDAAGQVISIATCNQAHAKTYDAPDTITDDDVFLVRSYLGDGAAERMMAARSSATPAPASTAKNSNCASMSLRDATKVILASLRAVPDPDFDRARYEATVRERRDRIANTSGKYDGAKFLVAVAQLRAHPAGLTDDDLVQLRLVDPNLGDEARARRGGYVKAAKPPDADDQMASWPVSALAMLEFVGQVTDALKLEIATVVRLARETSARVDFVDRRLAAPVNGDDRAQLAAAHDEIAALTARIKQLEERQYLSYHGVWNANKSYAPGNLITHAGGLWICHAAVKGAIPGGVLEVCRSWQLVSKGRS